MRARHRRVSPSRTKITNKEELHQAVQRLLDRAQELPKSGSNVDLEVLAQDKVFTAALITVAMSAKSWLEVEVDEIKMMEIIHSVVSITVAALED